VRALTTDEDRHAFLHAVLRDLQALETLIGVGGIESGIHRFGAEQELFLVDRMGHAAPVAMEVLGLVDDPRIVTELARFNLEINATPRLLEGGCFAELQTELQSCLDRVHAAAQQVGAGAILRGSCRHSRRPIS
jgi:hypothetical protein